MRIERFSLALLLAVVLFLAAIPLWRGLALSQLRQTVPLESGFIWDGSTKPYVPNPHPKTDAQLLKEHPRDFRLRLALAMKVLGDSESGNSARAKEAAASSARALVRDFPKEGAAYVVLLCLPEYTDREIPARPEGNGLLPEDTPKGWHNIYPPTGARIEACNKVVAVLDKAIAVAPQNGWFHSMKVEYLYGVHRDAEAIAEMHAAAVAPRFTDCTDNRADAWNYYCDLRGDFDPQMRGIMPSLLFFPYFAHARDSARITGHLAHAKISGGDTDTGVRMALDVTGAGYNMAKHSSTLIQALVGQAIMAIGGDALDPNYNPKTDEVSKARAKQIVHYSRFLSDHGYKTEAATLAAQWRPGQLLTKSVHDYSGDEVGVTAFSVFPLTFMLATGTLAILLISLLLWIIGWAITRRSRGQEFWDRRSGVTSAMLSCLVLAPMVVCFIGPRSDGPFDLGSLMRHYGLDGRPLNLQWLLIPVAVALLAFAIGLAMMLMRPPRECKNRCMPVWSLLLIYASALASLGYIAYGFADFKESSEFFAGIEPFKTAIVILIPSVALLLYARLRAWQSRSSRLLNFAATIRYGSAFVVGLSAIIYLGLVVCTASFGVRADAFARDSFKNEAAIVQKAFK